MSNGNHRLFQIFRAGRQTAMSGATLDFTEAQLTACAHVYNRALRAAPLVLGHPEDNRPAFGEVLGLFCKNGGLYAQAKVSDGLVQAVRAGHYKKVSASFHMPFSQDNPVSGAFYLRHVGFLGAMPPAVKRLEALVFGEGEALGFSEEANEPEFFTTLPVAGERLALHQAAQHYRAVCPALSYAEAVGLAESIITF
ncbi:MAG: hypothetical protein HYV16_14060 [Gammaproteobacteria bacterium]|nr:hypothetical protein [Gammaproteobacteria bacterium]